MLAVVTLGLALSGSGAWYFLHRNHIAQAAPAEPEPSEQRYTFPLESFTVNLADQKENYFLRVTITLGLDQAPEAGKKEDGGANAFPVARVRDTILPRLAICRADALLTPEGKDDLKRDIVQALQQNVPEIGVREIYFTEFLVQR